MAQKDGQHKKPQTLESTNYCLEAFNNCTNYCRYWRKCKYSHDTDFQKLKKSGVRKFELNAKENCANSDKCKWSHQILKLLYREKTKAVSAASPSYTTYSQKNHQGFNLSFWSIVMKIYPFATFYWVKHENPAGTQHCDNVGFWLSFGRNVQQHWSNIVTAMSFQCCCSYQNLTLLQHCVFDVNFPIRR